MERLWPADYSAYVGQSGWWSWLTDGNSRLRSAAVSCQEQSEQGENVRPSTARIENIAEGAVVGGGGGGEGRGGDEVGFAGRAGVSQSVGAGEKQRDGWSSWQ